MRWTKKKCCTYIRKKRRRTFMQRKKISIWVKKIFQDIKIYGIHILVDEMKIICRINKQNFLFPQPEILLLEY